jgi:WD40 repeat protein
LIIIIIRKKIFDNYNDISSDGLQLVAGSDSTSIGTLDIPSRSYHTFLRSHSKTILAITGIRTGDETDGKTEFATASEDKTVRIWCARFPKMDQVFEFSFAADVPLCIASHPRERLLAVGFSSGFMRVLGLYYFFFNLLISGSKVVNFQLLILYPYLRP